MLSENPEALTEESPLITAAPAHVRLTQKQRQALIFLAFAVPLWLLLSLLTVVNHLAMLIFIAGSLLLVVVYGMKTEHLLFLWFAINVYNQALKWLLGVQILGVGIKGLFFVAVLTQLPNKFSLMPRRLFRTVPLRWPFYLLLLWTGASVFWSDFPMYGLNRYLTWLMSFLLYAMVFLTINDRNKRMFFIVFAVVVGTSVLFGLLQRFGLSIFFASSEEIGPDVFMSEYWVGGASHTMFRATGFAGHPNMFGRECVLLFCVLLMMLISWRPRRLWRVVILGMLGVTLATTVLSYSRVAWVLFGAGVAAFMVLTKPRYILVMVFVMALAALVAHEQIWARIEPLFHGTDSSIGMRQYSTSVYLEHWRSQPLTGYGFGSTGGGALYEARVGPHEGYVYLLSQLGLVGLCIYMLVLLGLPATALRVLRDRFVRADKELYAMAALGASIAVILLVNFLVGVGMYIHTWYLLGCTFAVLRIARSRTAKPQPPAANRQIRAGRAAPDTR